MNIVERNGLSVAVIDKATAINGTPDILDLMAAVRYESDCMGMIVNKESLGEDFFDLKTRVAGDVLQKFSNYRFKLAIVGDFSAYTSKSLKDFIYESNKGSLVFFKESIEEALTALTSRP